MVVAFCTFERPRFTSKERLLLTNCYEGLQCGGAQNNIGQNTCPCRQTDVCATGILSATMSLTHTLGPQTSGKATPFFSTVTTETLAIWAKFLPSAWARPWQIKTRMRSMQPHSHKLLRPHDHQLGDHCMQCELNLLLVTPPTDLPTKSSLKPTALQV